MKITLEGTKEELSLIATCLRMYAVIGKDALSLNPDEKKKLKEFAETINKETNDTAQA